MQPALFSLFSGMQASDQGEQLERRGLFWFSTYCLGSPVALLPSALGCWGWGSESPVSQAPFP